MNYLVYPARKQHSAEPLHSCKGHASDPSGLPYLTAVSNADRNPPNPELSSVASFDADSRLPESAQLRPRDPDRRRFGMETGVGHRSTQLPCLQCKVQLFAERNPNYSPESNIGFDMRICFRICEA